MHELNDQLNMQSIDNIMKTTFVNNPQQQDSMEKQCLSPRELVNSIQSSVQVEDFSRKQGLPPEMV